VVLLVQNKVVALRAVITHLLIFHHCQHYTYETVLDNVQQKRFLSRVDLFALGNRIISHKVTLSVKKKTN